METDRFFREKGIGGLSHSQSERDKRAHSDENCMRLNRRKAAICAQFDFGAGFLEGVVMAFATIVVKVSRVIGRIFFRVSSRGSKVFRIRFITILYHAGCNPNLRIESPFA